MRAARAIVLLGALAACGGRPDLLQDSRPWIQLSATTVRFEVDPHAFATPQEVAITTPGTERLSVPAVSIRYVGPGEWLKVTLGGDPSRYLLSLTPRVPTIATLTPGATYSATVSVAAPGAANTPAIAVELHVLRTPVDVGFREGPATLTQHVDYSPGATPLLDGGVLLSGDAFVQPYAERMDPDTGVWSKAGIETNRHEHTATLLEDGRVFLAGGSAFVSGSNQDESTWEIYDPSVGVIVASGPLARPRSRHAAVRLLDGRVLLIGGIADGDQAAVTARSAEVFDPRTQASRSVGSLLADYLANQQEGAVLLHDGRVLIAGGTIFSGAQGVDNVYGVAELFDPTTERWTPTGSLNLPRHTDHAIATLPTGEVLLFGGHDQDYATGVASEIYDPETGTWRLADPLLHPRSHIRDCAVVLPSGKVLVAGGEAWDPVAEAVTWTSSVEIYDPADGQWHEGPTLDGPRSWHSVILLPYGRLMIVGGQGGTANATEYWTELAE